MTGSIPPVEIAEVDIRPLTGHAAFDHGGQAEISWAAAPSGEVMLFKRYRPTVLLPNSRQRLGEMVMFRRELKPHLRDYLDERAAWMRHVVIAGAGTVAGVLIPPAPAQFWWTDKRDTVKAREISQLAPDPGRALRLSKDHFSVPQIIARLGHLLETMRFLHQNGVVIGDVHSGNVLITGLWTRPRTFLVDCDAMILDRHAALVRAELPKLWSSEMPPWPDPFDRSCDLAFFSYMAVGLIGKDLSLIAVTPEVRRNLLTDHANMLDLYLHRRDPEASAADLGAVAALWQTYASDGKEEYARQGNSRDRRVWKGPSSFSAPHSFSPQYSATRTTLPSPLPPRIPTPVPTAATQPAPAPPLVFTPAAAAPTRPAPASQGRPKRPKAPHTPFPTRPRLGFRAAAGAVLTALIAAIGATAAGAFNNHPHVAPRPPAALVLAPEKVPVAQDNLAKTMTSFPNIKQAAGTLTVAAPAPIRQHGAVTETVTITEVQTAATQPLQLSYSCTPPDRNLKTANLAPGPYLLVSGLSPTVATASAFAMPGWEFNTTKPAPARYSLYSPVCTFLDSTKVPVPAAIVVPANGQWKPVPAKAPKAVFVLPPDGKSAGPVTKYPYTSYAFVWVASDGRYLFTKLGK